MLKNKDIYFLLKLLRCIYLYPANKYQNTNNCCSFFFHIYEQDKYFDMDLLESKL